MPISDNSSSIDALRAEIKKLSAASIQAKMRLHDLAEELPTAWETVPDVAQKTYDIFQKLTAKRAELKSLGA